jgi:hypothetical protein
MPGRACKHCGARIQFIEREGRWIPVDPGTEDRHTCPTVTKYCETCEKPFEGASWMKQCRRCHHLGAGARNKPQDDARPARTREPLKEVPDDDVPF